MVAVDQGFPDPLLRGVRHTVGHAVGRPTGRHRHHPDQPFQSGATLKPGLEWPVGAHLHVSSLF
jgi:hypothetical protein